MGVKTPTGPLVVVTPVLNGEVIDKGTKPLLYTDSPLKLFFKDLGILALNIGHVLGVVLPLFQCPSGKYCEQYPWSWGNAWAMNIHGILMVLQSAFLISLPFLAGFAITVPVTFAVGYFVGFLVLNYLVCLVLLNNNIKDGILVSTVPKWAADKKFQDKFADEEWFFINGVSVGHHWLQSAIDRISLSFGRKVTGIHNPTAGVFFDLIQCIIQRDLTYVTEDVRICYTHLKEALLKADIKKVVLILHSQGGIEGGLVLDWLLATVPADDLRKLEIYTFGNAANHFNNTRRETKASKHGQKANDITSPDQPPTQTYTLGEIPDDRAIRYIEHYGNKGDPVARIGVLRYGALDANHINDRFAGRIFERNGTGHQLNQHYLDHMFPIDLETNKCYENNEFMDAPALIAQPDKTTKGTKILEVPSVDSIPNVDSMLSPRVTKSDKTVGEVSRLWKYRNGGKPKDD